MQKILIVDDDPQFRTLLVPMLSKRGYEVLEAETGKAARYLLAKESPDLIVIDGVLPDTDGLTWIQEVRDAGLRTPIAYASAYWRDKKTFKKLQSELGVALVVLKPIMAQLFVEQLIQQLAVPAAPSQGAPPTREMEEDEEFVQIQHAYGRGLPGKAGEIASALDGLRNKEPNASEKVRSLAHRLRGTAGSYGFPAAGEAAGQIEDLVTDASRVLAAADWASLHAAIVSLTAAAATAADQSGAVEANGVLPGDRILVVDDDPSFLGYVGELARRYAMDVVPALDAEAAIQMVRSHRPGAAILDVVLGAHETSFKLARDLRALPGCESLPIAFISAYDSQQTRIAAAHAGGSIFLAKPLDGALFADAGQQLLAQRPTKPRVLVVDDDAEFRSWAHTVLSREEMQVEGLSGTDDILGNLERHRPDVLLLDVMLKGTNGFDICRLVRTTPLWRDLPVLFFTSQVDTETRIAAFQAGGDDYLVKPVVAEELLARVRVRLDRARLMRERADIDALTGICLRRSFMSRFGALLSAADRRDTAVSLCLIDVDHFKAVNDTHGHLSGDRVLSAFGRLLATRFRTTDLRARWGGEEFMLAFPGETTESTAGITDRLLEEVRNMSFESDSASRFSITFSAGVASYPTDGGTVHDLVRTVDRRLYIAKRAGRNQVVSKG